MRISDWSSDVCSSYLGVIAAEITFFPPFVVRPLLAAFTQIPREQLDVAASLGASPVRVLRQVVMPAAWPALLAGGSLVLQSGSASYRERVCHDVYIWVVDGPLKTQNK